MSPLLASKGCGRFEPQLAHEGSEVSRVELRAEAVHIDIDRKKASNLELQFVDCCVLQQLREPASAQVSPLLASKGCGRFEPQLAHEGSEVSRVELRAEAVHIDIDRKKASNLELQFVDCCVLQELREPASWPFRATARTVLRETVCDVGKVPQSQTMEVTKPF